MNKLLKPILGGVAIMLTIPALYLPLRLQNIYKRAMSVITYKLKDFKIVTNLMIQNSNTKMRIGFLPQDIEQLQIDYDMERYKMSNNKKGNNKKEEEVSILFSGGWDSTLAAFKLCETFKKVHLLTYYHSNSDFTENSKVNVNKLKDRFGSDKIIHKIIDVDQLKEELYRGTWRQDRKNYGLFLINCECSGCRIAMFTRTLIYNLENNITYLASGEVETAPLNFVPGLSDKLDELKRELCNDYGILYLRPVYHEKNPHKRLFELGLIDKEVKHIKFPYEYLFHETQPTCYVGPFSPIFNKFYYLPYRGKKALEEIKLKYFKEKLEVAREWIKTTRFHEINTKTF